MSEILYAIRNETQVRGGFFGARVNLTVGRNTVETLALSSFISFIFYEKQGYTFRSHKKKK